MRRTVAKLLETELIIVLAIATILGVIIGYSLAAAKTDFAPQLLKITSGSEATLPR